MANDPSLALRRALVVGLRANAVLTALVPSVQIYGPRSPADTKWPFIRVHISDTVPSKADCYDGADMRATVHVFALGADEGACADIAKAAAKTLDDAILPKDGYSFIPEWTGTQTFADNDEGSQWHSVVSFKIEVDGI